MSSSTSASGSFSGSASGSNSESVSTVHSRTTTANHPLTTIFTPPASCDDILYTFSTAHSGLSTFWRNANGPGTACYPPGFALQYQTALSAEYSPGVCPAGYTPAETVINPSQRAQTSWCCPNGMTYEDGVGCLSTVTTATRVALNPDTITTISATFVAADYYIKVAWASTQLDQFTPAFAPLLPVALQTATNTSNVTSFGVPPPKATSAPLTTTSEKAGFAAGIGTFAVAVFAVAVFALWTRKRKRPKTGDQTGLIDPEDAEKLQTEQAEQSGSHENNRSPEMNQTDAAASVYSRVSDEVAPSVRAPLESGWYEIPITTGTERGR